MKLVDITKELMEEYFENNFLNQVAFEVRFPADLTMKDTIPQFQKLLKNDFNTFSEKHSFKVPFGKEVESTHIKDYGFRNEKAENEIYLNKYSIFGLTTSKYEGYKGFSNLFFVNLEKMKNHFEINEITRIGIRYVNIIPLSIKKNKANELHKMWFNSLISEEFNFNRFTNQHIDLRFKENGYNIHLRFIFSQDEKKKYIIILDIDNSFVEKNPINIDSIKKIIEDLHTGIKQRFFQLINEEFLKVLRDKKNV